MANPEKAVPQNTPGDFFVDSTCIDCDTCRQLAPQTFGQASDSSFVRHQPTTPDERRDALHALLSCPTGSIGTQADDNVKPLLQDFPLLIEDPVYYCGFNSPKSYGGNSYFIRHPAGNWLIDSPKFITPLVKQLESLGGVKHIFLTHRDDVADADRYAAHFHAQRIIHQQELSSQPAAEKILTGDGPWQLAPGFLAISTPGHTKGHIVLLLNDRFLFTGDHLDWDRERQQLAASENYCWHSWPDQINSIAKLSAYQFDWVLPGHGQKIHLPPSQMQSALQSLIASLT